MSASIKILNLFFLSFELFLFLLIPCLIINNHLNLLIKVLCSSVLGTLFERYHLHLSMTHENECDPKIHR